MSSADIAFRVLLGFIYLTLTIAGVYFLVIYVKKAISKKRNTLMSYVSPDDDSYGANDILTVPSYVNIISIISFIDRVIYYSH